MPFCVALEISLHGPGAGCRRRHTAEKVKKKYLSKNGVLLRGKSKDVRASKTEFKQFTMWYIGLQQLTGVKMGAMLTFYYIYVSDTLQKPALAPAAHPV